MRNDAALTPEYRVFCLRTATHTAPEPIFLYMKGFGRTVDVNCYFWLAQGNGRNVLVDTGMGGDYPGRLTESARRSEASFPVGDGEDTLSQLARHGLRPENIDVVILTHLHYDHIANVQLFENAEIVVNRKGWEAARNPIHPVFDVFPKDVLDYMATRMKAQLRLAADEETIAPGIDVLWTGGHTRCSQAVKLQTAKGKVVLTGDVAYLYENLMSEHPIGLGVSLYESVDALRRLKREGDIVLPGHDKEILERYPGGVIV
ncbi:N-acyl homoserine lactonase family protein [Paenibacillus sp.]|uniref:N-acyl homoserine lactonase family protein n=1 Tax=Paenibacillus sp. TaxID=58172 RepID=UPI002D31A33A|nr:N-acyl homoserine lactonase family protein [Paenibacillus sp.]HZG58868.1 N-acyl homoserine lactonase family protein [Paenibacillus sp.]